MIAGIIVGSIVLLLLLILFCPVVLLVSFEEQLQIRVRIFCFTIPILPQKEKTPEQLEKERRKQEKKKRKKKREQEVKEEEKKKRPSKLRQMLSERGVSGFLHLLTEAAKLAAGTGKKILSHVTVYHMQADVRIVGKDAADTAAKYGQACAVGYPAFGRLSSAVRCRRPRLSLTPDFTAEHSQVRFSAKAGIQPWFVITAAIGMGVRLVRLLRRKEEKTEGSILSEK